MTAHSGDLLISAPLGREEGVGSRWLWKEILLPFVLTRILLLFVAFLTVNTMDSYERFAPVAKVDIPHAWINAWSRWDSIWYLRIVRSGYFYDPGHQSSVAFFPLYPALMKLGGYVLGQHNAGWIHAGILISNAALVVALIYLWKLVRLDFDERVARRAVLYCLIGPMTLFLSAAYPMSLILAIALAAFYYARVREWRLVGAIAALAPMARPDGVLLIPGLLFEYLHQRDFRWRQIRADVLPMILMPSLMLAAWMGYLYHNFNDALAFVHVQKYWPSSTLADARSGDWDALTGVLTALFAAGILGLGWRWLPRSYLVYASLHFLLMVSSSRFSSVPRFLLVLFPIYIVLALLGQNKQFDRSWTILSTCIATFMLMRFVLCYFVG